MALIWLSTRSLKSFFHRRFWFQVSKPAEVEEGRVAIMASTVTDMVTKTVSVTASTASSTSRAAAQGGILEGSNPSTYDPKNPIIIFIIQVSLKFAIPAPPKLTFLQGWHYPHLLSITSLSSLKDKAAPSHCRSHRRGPFGPLCHGFVSQAMQDFLPVCSDVTQDEFLVSLMRYSPRLPCQI